MTLVATLLALFMLVSYRYVCMGAISKGTTKAPACERHHVVMDPVNETLWTFSPYDLRRHELQLLNPQDNVDLLIPGQMLCVKALELEHGLTRHIVLQEAWPRNTVCEVVYFTWEVPKKEENYRPQWQYPPYMVNWSRVVSIAVTTHDTSEMKYCTGTFLDERTVITTASCVLQTSEENVKVVLRDTSELEKLSNAERRGKPVPTSQANVQKIVVHPEYFPENGQSHNVAVLFLTEGTQLDSTSRLLLLPDESAEKTENAKETYVVHRNFWWQRYVLRNGTEGVNKSRTEMKLWINKGLIPVDPSKCREMFWAQGYDDFYLPDDMLCTVMHPDEYYHDVCHESNGAPLVMVDEGQREHFVIGIAVATAGDCTQGKRGHDFIFVDLRHKSNLEWLRKTVQPLSPLHCMIVPA